MDEGHISGEWESWGPSAPGFKPLVAGSHGDVVWGSWGSQRL